MVFLTSLPELVFTYGNKQITQKSCNNWKYNQKCRKFNISSTFFDNGSNCKNKNDSENKINSHSLWVEPEKPAVAVFFYDSAIIDEDKMCW